MGEETFNTANSPNFGVPSSLLEDLPEAPQPLDNSTFDTLSSEDVNQNTTSEPPTSGLVVQQAAPLLAQGMVQIFEPSLNKARTHLKELM